MTDAQLIGLVIALAVTPLATLTVVLLGRSAEQRYVKVEADRLDSRITLELKAFEAQLKGFESRIENRIERLESALLSRMAELDTRLAKLESR